ncbi:MAG: transglutaminase-like cysteine peptidase [Deltaproteobacteria bacterium]|nr:MAG: transglutaminase-like cysteine peptidase [Deltaproteobacteria bacterium]
MVFKQTDKIEYFFLFIVFFSFLIGIAPIITGENFQLSSELLNKAESKYGKDARSLLVAWEEIIIQDTSQTDLEKLERVNDFFNQMEFVDDTIHWGEKDYWATPIEFLGTQGGDCEDFSIAKYFTLKAMGIDEEKLNLTYVKALNYNVHHMVLTYFSAPGAEPLVLDNLVGEIKPASKRTDLIPIYSFNGTGLWLAKQRGRGKLAGSSSRLQRWQDLIQRMSEDDL